MLRWRGSTTSTVAGAPQEALQEDQSPTRVSPKRKQRSTLSVLLLLLVSLAIGVLVIAPAVFYASPWIRRHTVFLTFVNLPPFPRLSDPRSYDLRCAHNFYIDSEEAGLRLGAWHIPPASSVDRLGCQQLDQDWFAHDKRPAVLYLHGNGGSRAGGHRVSLYKVLTGSLDAHVLALDYRGYGDSGSGPMGPSAEALAQDSRTALRWLQARTTGRPLIVWGHSLGTGVAIRLMEDLQHRGEAPPAGLVLEAPFDALHRVAATHPLSLPYRWLPYFELTFVASLKNDPVVEFNSTTRARFVSPKLPVLVLHARDDATVPFALGETLHEAFREARQGNPSAGPLLLHAYDGRLGYGHKHLHRDPELTATVAKFFALNRTDIRP
nr:lysophosphatidylserine lipase ABHD12-like [Dermacentor andersoni]